MPLTICLGVLAPFILVSLLLKVRPRKVAALTIALFGGMEVYYFSFAVIALYRLTVRGEMFGETTPTHTIVLMNAAGIVATLSSFFALYKLSMWYFGKLKWQMRKW